MGELYVVEHVRTKPTRPISRKELNQLRALAGQAAQNGLAKLARAQGPWKPLALNEVGLRIDNHAVLDGVGLTGREMSLSVFGVAVQTGLWRALEALAKKLNLTVANVVTAPQALAGLIPQSEAIVLDVGLTGTTICLVREDALAAATWLPIGGDFFTRHLAKKMELTTTDATDLKHAFAANALATEESEFLDHLLHDKRQQWHEGVVKALANLIPNSSLPWKIYLTGGGSTLPGLKRTFRVNPTYFDRVPDVTRIRRPYLTGIKDLTTGLDYNRFSLALSLTVGLPDRFLSD